MNENEIVSMLRKEELDCNDSELFFSKLLKALMVDLRNLIKIRGKAVPHIIYNTGDDTIWLIEKDYDYSKEPCEVTNEQYIYSQVPRCGVTIGSLDMVPDQLTNPYVRGDFQFEYDSKLYTLNAEFRRFPVKVNIGLKYVLDSFTDTLQLMQHICTKLAFIRTFKFVYLGQTMIASYKIPESVDDQHLTEISGDTTESRDRTVELQIEVESNIPVFSSKTVASHKVVVHPTTKLKLDRHETIERDFASGSGYRGPRFGTR